MDQWRTARSSSPGGLSPAQSPSRYPRATATTTTTPAPLSPGSRSPMGGIGAGTPSRTSGTALPLETPPGPQQPSRGRFGWQDGPSLTPSPSSRFPPMSAPRPRTDAGMYTDNEAMSPSKRPHDISPEYSAATGGKASRLPESKNPSPQTKPEVRPLDVTVCDDHAASDDEAKEREEQYYESCLLTVVFSVHLVNLLALWLTAVVAETLHGADSSHQAMVTTYCFGLPSIALVAAGFGTIASNMRNERKVQRLLEFMFVLLGLLSMSVGVHCLLHFYPVLGATPSATGLLQIAWGGISVVFITFPIDILSPFTDPFMSRGYVFVEWSLEFVGVSVMLATLEAMREHEHLRSSLAFHWATGVSLVMNILLFPNLLPTMRAKAHRVGFMAILTFVSKLPLVIIALAAKSGVARAPIVAAMVLVMIAQLCYDLVFEVVRTLNDMAEYADSEGDGRFRSQFEEDPGREDDRDGAEASERDAEAPPPRFAPEQVVLGEDGGEAPSSSRPHSRWTTSFPSLRTAMFGGDPTSGTTAGSGEERSQVRESNVTERSYNQPGATRPGMRSAMGGSGISRLLTEGRGDRAPQESARMGVEPQLRFLDGPRLSNWSGYPGQIRRRGSIDDLEVPVYHRHGGLRTPQGLSTPPGTRDFSVRGAGSAQRPREAASHYNESGSFPQGGPIR